MKRRFFRIWPLYAIAVVFSALGFFSLSRRSPNPIDVIAHLSLTHNFFAGLVFGVGNGPLWTMAVDVQFYVLLPIVAWLTMKFVKGRSQHDRISLVSAFVIVAIVASCAYRALMLHVHPSLFRGLTGPFYVVERGVIGMGSVFGVGLALAILKATDVRVNRGIAASLIVVGCILSALALTSALPPFTIEKVALGDFMGGLSIATLYFGVTQLRLISLEALCASIGVVTMADTAYAVYLFHIPLLKYTNSVLQVFTQSTSPHFGVKLAVSSMLVILPVSYLIHRIVEKPFLRIREQARELA